MQYVTLRGISEDKLKQPPDRAQKQQNLPGYECNSITEMLNLYLSYSTYATINNVTVVHKSLDVRTPFPRIFDSSINQDGYVSAIPRPQHLSKFSVGSIESRIYTYYRIFNISLKCVSFFK